MLLTGFERAITKLLRRHGKTIVDQQLQVGRRPGLRYRLLTRAFGLNALQLARVANVAIDMYAIMCTLARASKSISEGPSAGEAAARYGYTRLIV
jgi:hypothetical protein